MKIYGLSSKRNMEEKYSNILDNKSGEKLAEVLHKFVGEKWQSQCTHQWKQKNMEDLLEQVQLLRQTASADELKSQKLLVLIHIFCDKLSRINNPNLLTAGQEILSLLIDDVNSSEILKTVVQLVSNASQMTYDESFISFPCLFDFLDICLTTGAVPSDDDMEKIASLVDTIHSSSHFTLYLQTLELSLKSYRTENKHKVIKCNFDGLKDLYHIPSDIIQSGKKIIHRAYQTQGACLQTRSFINNLLFMACGDDCKIYLDEILSLPTPGNWLLRNSLHYMAMLIYEEHIFQSLPKSFIEEHIDKTDLHGCTPLHLAYLHDNQRAVGFLLANGASETIVDNYGISPKYLQSRFCVPEKNDSLQDDLYNEMLTDDFDLRQEHDVVHQKKCCDVMKATTGVLAKLKPMLVLSGTEADELAEEAKELVKRVIEQTKYSEYVKDIVLTGSVRDRLKAGRLEEVDVQLWFHRHTDFRDLAVNLPGVFSKGLASINWCDIHLRPVTKGNPLECIWEGPGSVNGMHIAVDLVPVCEGRKYDYQSSNRQRLILQDAQLHKRVEFLKWNKRASMWFRSPRLTHFPYEWDIMASLPTGCKLGILIAKALIQAYDWCNKSSHPSVNMPMSSYMVKTAVLHILAGNVVCSPEESPERSSEGIFEKDDDRVLKSKQNGKQEDYCSCWRNASFRQHFDQEEHLGDWRNRKIEHKTDPKWLDEEDIKEHGEEGRIWARQIFKTIKHFAKQNQRLPTFWDGFYGIAFDPSCENEYMEEICDCLLQKTEKSAFYGPQIQRHSFKRSITIEDFDYEASFYSR